jgi:L-fuculose-phosphate aldolase
VIDNRASLSEDRLAVRDVALAMAHRGLATGSSGNVSVRRGERLLITASGIPYEHLRTEQIIEIDLDGTWHSGEGEPSSEWRMHAAIYGRRCDAVAIVHTHSLYATAAAIALGALPIPHDEGRIVFGSSVPVSKHHPPGTWELAHAVAEALGEGTLALIARHGAVAVGKTLDDALLSAVKLEEIAQLQLLSQQFLRHG